MTYQFDYITASGTFDRLHKGHKYFLKQAFKLGKTVLVGITSDKYVKHKPHSELIEPFTKRKARVVNFLKAQHLLNRAKIFQLKDVIGPAINKNNPVQAILVTEKTKKGGKLINQERQKLGFTPVKIVTIDLVKNNNGQAVSAQDIRKRLLTSTLFLPQHLRPLLKKPFGKLYLGSQDNLKVALKKVQDMLKRSKPTAVICVGDVVTRLLNEAIININLAVVDFRINRKKVIKNLKQLGFNKNRADFMVVNKPGRVSFQLAHAVEQALRIPDVNQIIGVVGEEDLAVLPALIFAPLGSVILYGQPNEGIVAVSVNQNSQKRAFRLANKFEKS